MDSLNTYNFDDAHSSIFTNMLFGGDDVTKLTGWGRFSKDDRCVQYGKSVIRCYSYYADMLGIMLIIM